MGLSGKNDLMIEKIARHFN